MISHEYQCIFIHIPRTAGSSIEKWIYGEDWWKVDRKSKHLLASQAKELYQEHWDSYFKFAFVRNPWDRMVSCLKYGKFYHIQYNRRMNFINYMRVFGFPVTIENDYRFSDRKLLRSEQHQRFCVYQNILDEEMDFIGRYENLKEDCAFLKTKLGIPTDFPYKEKLEVSERRPYRDYYDFLSKRTVKMLFYKDIEKFGYTF